MHLGIQPEPIPKRRSGNESSQESIEKANPREILLIPDKDSEQSFKSVPENNVEETTSEKLEMNKKDAKSSKGSSEVTIKSLISHTGDQVNEIEVEEPTPPGTPLVKSSDNKDVKDSDAESKASLIENEESSKQVIITNIEQRDIPTQSKDTITKNNSEVSEESNLSPPKDQEAKEELIERTPIKVQEADVSSDTIIRNPSPDRLNNDKESFVASPEEEKVEAFFHEKHVVVNKVLEESPREETKATFTKTEREEFKSPSSIEDKLKYNSPLDTNEYTNASNLIKQRAVSNEDNAYFSENSGKERSQSTELRVQHVSDTKKLTGLTNSSELNGSNYHNQMKYFLRKYIDNRLPDCLKSYRSPSGTFKMRLYQRFYDTKTMEEKEEVRWTNRYSMSESRAMVYQSQVEEMLKKSEKKINDFRV